MTIAEVSRQYDISADTLRYYERMGLLPHVGRTSGGIRNYSEDDCHWVEYIKCMRSAGVSVETLLEYVTSVSYTHLRAHETVNLLLEQRERIVARINELNQVLARLDWKLDGYEERMLSYEEHLK